MKVKLTENDRLVLIAIDDAALELEKRRADVLERAKRRQVVIHEPPYPNTVVKFEKTMGGRTFTYAAIRSDVNEGTWYTTGPANSQYSWAKLVGWLGPEASTIRLMFPGVLLSEVE